MAKLSLNKATLHKESAKLKRYKQYLPSLDLKRQQLMTERAKAQSALVQLQQDVQACQDWVAANLPMLANRDIAVQNLVKVEQIEVKRENVVGVNLPKLSTLKISREQYSFFVKPHWVDRLVVELERMLLLQIQLRVQQQRLTILNMAVKKVTQKVNLFDKVLIPKSLHNIRKIRLSLSDAERADVVRAKITKQLRSQQAT
jgi:V/A-type H+/Na+-transporting ATPase subunit D